MNLVQFTLDNAKYVNRNVDSAAILELSLVVFRLGIQMPYDQSFHF